MNEQRLRFIQAISKRYPAPDSPARGGGAGCLKIRAYDQYVSVFHRHASCAPVRSAFFRWLAVLLFCLPAYGCSGGLLSSWQGLRSTFAVSEESYRQKAIAYEKQGDLQQALMAWKVAARLAPRNESIPKIIKTLERGIANAARVHYKRGVTYYQEGNFTKARQEFLITLRLAPDHKRALYYMKTSLNNTDQESYRVQRGDSYIKIATDVYNDPSKAYLISYFNDLDPKKPLLIDTVLFLPTLSPHQLLPRKEISAMVDRAQEALDQKQYEAVLAITSKISEQSPDNEQSRTLSDTAHFALAEAAMEKKEYFYALEQLKQISDSFKGRDRAIRKARRHIQRQAVEEKLRMAQEQFKKGAYAGAINICEEVLAQDPSNKNAKALSDAAHYALGKQLLDQGKEAMAIDALSVLDEHYQDTAQLLTQARAKLNSVAENYYRKGVKYFLNEELEQAIEAWHQALALNPNHPKARQDIDNALRLLDKWRELDKTDKNGQ